MLIQSGCTEGFRCHVIFYLNQTKPSNAWNWPFFFWTKNDSRCPSVNLQRYLKMRRGATRSRRRSRPNRFSSCKVSKSVAKVFTAVSQCALTGHFVHLLCMQLSWASCRLTWRRWGSSGRTPSPPPERSCTRPRRRYCSSTSSSFSMSALVF